ncbi:hypothetical protein BT67DRAFT_4968 [Trichocladium antarcticum]|uniref:Secreted protein n=1 Tax=Trichocladium antarcticum TaxID=1450529 RepID=A0AAN6USA0_9PEZI|nr:hypothetical protein BT67DRAFT_4968 [Trichocladium antarcticum]
MLGMAPLSWPLDCLLSGSVAFRSCACGLSSVVVRTYARPLVEEGINPRPAAGDNLTHRAGVTVTEGTFAALTTSALQSPLCRPAELQTNRIETRRRHLPELLTSLAA